MRTRFLGTDSLGSVPIETPLDFLRCPPPELPPTHYSKSEPIEKCFDHVDVLNVSFEIEKLPIENSLSKFFFDVLPQITDVEFGDFTDDLSDCGTTACFDLRNSVFEIEIDASQKDSEMFSGEKGIQNKDEKTFAAKGTRDFKLVQFEVPEQKYDIVYQTENTQIFSETSHLAIEDMPVLEIGQQQFLDIQQLICPVDSLLIDYFVEKKVDLSEDSGFSTEKVVSSHSTFCLLEIDEASLGISNSISIADEVITFEDIESQKLTQEDSLINDEKELLGFEKLDLLMYLSNHCPAIQCPELQAQCSNFFEQIDFIGDVEDSENRKVLSFHLQTSDCISVSARSIILYEEFQFIDLEQFHFFQVFCDIALVEEVEKLEDIFGEAIKFRSFDELIVPYELTLTDASFKSLPVPILSDSPNIGSLQSFADESLNKLELVSSSISDGLYLDWHVLEEDNCNYDKHFSCWKVLMEIETYNIDSSLNIFDNRTVMLNFVLSDGMSDETYLGESKETLNVLLDELLVSPLPSSGAPSGKPPKNDQIKRLHVEMSSEIGAEITESVESLAQFNDLDFFLNPRDCTRGVQSEISNLPLDSHKVFPASSSTDNMASYATMEVGLQQGNKKMRKIKLSDEILGLMGTPEALCHGVDMAEKIRSTMGGDPRSTSMDKVEELLNFLPVVENNNRGHSTSKDKVEELLNFSPVEENNNRGQMDAVDVDEARFKRLDHCLPLAMESNVFHESKLSFPDKVIIVNTQNFEKSMVISRRSTYQKILAMEKEGTQIVERDLGLPVDILVNASVCLTWYDLKNIGKKSSALDETFSCLPLCMENIAASILTSLSFSFSSCILVFEGEKSFIAGIMESSDELYAAAASLGIDFQIFCSYSSEMTDEIILSCIKSANKQIRGLYPRMPESETIAESFLTAFPSINPLAAHAILSSGGMLVEFLEWSGDRRIRAVQEYKIPSESVALLSLLSKYGEREDSRSALTDSSSSVCYTPDMQNCHPKSIFDKTKRVRDENLQSDNMRANGSHIEALKRFADGRSNFPGEAGPNDFWMSENSGINDRYGKPALSSGDKFGQNEELEANMSMITSKISPQYDFNTAEGCLTFEEKKKAKIHDRGSHFGSKERLNITARNELYGHNYKNSGNQLEDFVGEVINIDDTTTLGNNVSKVDLFSLSPLKIEKDSTAGTSRTARKLHFGSSSFPDFPTSAQITSDSDSWLMLGDHQNSSFREQIDYFDSNISNTQACQNQQKRFSYESAVQKTASNSQDLPLVEKDNVQRGGTPLWNAVHTNESLRQSPWTIEFLNKIKEKSRLHKQSLPRGLSSPNVGHSRNVPKATKRRSPSILEFYKYQGDGVAKRTVEQKRQKRTVRPPCSSKKASASASILPTWTPADKRAKQTLSFATSGNGAQSKLIWSDQSSHTKNRRFGPRM